MTRPTKLCLDCGRRHTEIGPRCRSHELAHQAARNQARKALYGGQYSAFRKKVLQAAYGRPCPHCGVTMIRSQIARQGATYDHATNLAMCRSCNSSQRRNA